MAADFTLLQVIGSAFQLPGKLLSFKTIDIGHINETIRVTFMNQDGKVDHYMFQRINTEVFKDPEAIMQNIELVTEHILKKKIPGQIAQRFRKTKEGKNYLWTEDGSFWRVWDYIEAVTFDSTKDLRVVKDVGEAFGAFETALSDLDGALLTETIPDFHNTTKRLQTLFSHEESDPYRRKEKVLSELKFFHESFEEAAAVYEAFRAGAYPVRVTHNDTKANNVLFDPVTKAPLAVIDLDTVMPGMASYDFADAARYICSSSEEDEEDVSRIYFDTEKFTALAKGFIGKVKGVLTGEEIDSFPEACFAITVETASRFLDDYLTGDKYFRTTYPGHNLVRARAGIALAKSIREKNETLHSIIRTVMA
ncbi:MAG: aminoglycoside phosphotransferase family protein [Lachnospiraceae bacterium]|nr:aminoglycoside phosphotransferase family protein [Lachnospiraceae bacterium]